MQDKVSSNPGSWAGAKKTCSRKQKLSLLLFLVLLHILLRILQHEMLHCTHLHRAQLMRDCWCQVANLTRRKWANYNYYSNECSGSHLGLSASQHDWVVAVIILRISGREVLALVGVRIALTLSKLQFASSNYNVAPHKFLAKTLPTSLFMALETKTIKMSWKFCQDSSIISEHKCILFELHIISTISSAKIQLNSEF